MKFIMIVVITSCAPNRALSTPGIAPHAPPERTAARKQSGTSSHAGHPANAIPTQAVANAAIVSCPSAPMFSRPQRKATATAEAGEDQRRRVEERVADAVRPGESAADQQLVGAERAVADQRDQHRADEKGRDHRGQGEEELAEGSHGFVAQAAASPPVISSPISSVDVRAGVDLGHDPSPAHDQQAVGERRHLLELGGDEQDGAAGVAQLDQPAVDELDAADVHAARRLRHQQELRRQRQLAAEDQLLLIAAGEGAGGEVEVRRADVEGFDDPLGAPADRRRSSQERQGPTATGGRSSTPRMAFSARSKSSSRPRRWRSSGTWAIPRSLRRGPVSDGDVHAAELDRAGRRSRRSTSPASASISSVWPFPSTPATPTISPARTVEGDAVEPLPPSRVLSGRDRARAAPARPASPPA